MNSNIDLKQLWQQQHTVMPDAKEIFALVDEHKRKNKQKLMLTNITFLFTAAFIISVWIKFQPQMITTKIGIMLIILAMVIFLFIYNKMAPLLAKAAPDADSNVYLQQLLKLQQRQNFLHHTMMDIYFGMLTTGSCLYMYEYASRSLTGIIVAYGLSLAWIAFNWFYIRPRTVRKQEEKTSEVIHKLKELSEQLSIIQKEEGK